MSGSPRARPACAHAVHAEPGHGSTPAAGRCAGRCRRLGACPGGVSPDCRCVWCHRQGTSRPACSQPLGPGVQQHTRGLRAGCDAASAGWHSGPASPLLQQVPLPCARAHNMGQLRAGRSARIRSQAGFMGAQVPPITAAARRGQADLSPPLPSCWCGGMRVPWWARLSRWACRAPPCCAGAPGNPLSAAPGAPAGTRPRCAASSTCQLRRPCMAAPAAALLQPLRAGEGLGSAELSVQLGRTCLASGTAATPAVVCGLAAARPGSLTITDCTVRVAWNSWLRLTTLSPCWPASAMCSCSLLTKSALAVKLGSSSRTACRAAGLAVRLSLALPSAIGRCGRQKHRQHFISGSRVKRVRIRVTGSPALGGTDSQRAPPGCARPADSAP